MPQFHDPRWEPAAAVPTTSSSMVAIPSVDLQQTAEGFRSASEIRLWLGGGKIRGAIGKGSSERHNRDTAPRDSPPAHRKRRRAANVKDGHSQDDALKGSPEEQLCPAPQRDRLQGQPSHGSQTAAQAGNGYGHRVAKVTHVPLAGPPRDSGAGASARLVQEAEERPAAVVQEVVQLVPQALHVTPPRAELTRGLVAEAVEEEPGEELGVLLADVVLVPPIGELASAEAEEPAEEVKVLLVEQKQAEKVLDGSGSGGTLETLVALPPPLRHVVQTFPPTDQVPMKAKDKKSKLKLLELSPLSQPTVIKSEDSQSTSAPSAIAISLPEERPGIGLGSLGAGLQVPQPDIANEQSIQSTGDLDKYVAQSFVSYADDFEEYDEDEFDEETFNEDSEVSIGSS